jgi:hypothetical protein
MRFSLLGRDRAMKKSYQKPRLERREKLAAISAANGGVTGSGNVKGD